MHEQVRREAREALALLVRGPRAEFTDQEWRRLVFLRWLYRTGRLHDAI